MSTIYKLVLSVILISLHSLSLAEAIQSPSLGIDAKQQSTHAKWNLTILPDGTGLPKGTGNAKQGAKLFQQKCSGCHGPEGIGASADPLIGEVGSLASNYPEKTVNSYWPYATTLFDYIRRTMPIDQPFSLTADEVYALCAYILSTDNVILKNVELNDETLPKVTMPNHTGFVDIYPSKN